VARREGAERPTLVFLGDYIDRGPDSREVIDLLLTGLPGGFDAHFLKGNHEAIMLDFLEDPSFLAQWLANGADATLRSYGVDVAGLVRKSATPEAWRRAFLASLPETHRDFFDTLELAVSFGDYLFVHAGLRPGVALEDQALSDLCWIRDDFLRHRESFGKMVVHGHSITEEIDERPNRIGIDTGAYATGRLAAIGLEGDERWYLST